MNSDIVMTNLLLTQLINRRPNEIKHTGNLDLNEPTFTPLTRKTSNILIVNEKTMFN